MSRILSGRFFVGMRGPYAYVQLVFSAIEGFDFTVPVSLDLTLTVEGPLGSSEPYSFVISPTDWTWSNKTATGAKATWVPDGTEFVQNGYHHFHGTLVADGAPIDLISFDEWVQEN